MDNIAELISDNQVDEILLVCRKLKRKRKMKVNCLTPEYRQKIKRMATKELEQWISFGVPESYMTRLVEVSSTLPEKFGLKRALQADVEILTASNPFEQPSNNNLVYFTSSECVTHV